MDSEWLICWGVAGILLIVAIVVAVIQTRTDHEPTSPTPYPVTDPEEIIGLIKKVFERDLNRGSALVFPYVLIWKPGEIYQVDVYCKSFIKRFPNGAYNVTIKIDGKLKDSLSRGGL